MDVKTIKQYNKIYLKMVNLQHWGKGTTLLFVESSNYKIYTPQYYVNKLSVQLADGAQVTVRG
jgi:hypothetical protein